MRSTGLGISAKNLNGLNFVYAAQEPMWQPSLGKTASFDGFSHCELRMTLPEARRGVCFRFSAGVVPLGTVEFEATAIITEHAPVPSVPTLGPICTPGP